MFTRKSHRFHLHIWSVNEFELQIYRLTLIKQDKKNKEIKRQELFFGEINLEITIFNYLNGTLRRRIYARKWRFF